MKADWLSRNKGERKWLLVEAGVRGVGTRDEPLRAFAWEAISYPDRMLTRLHFSNLYMTIV